MMSRMPCLGVGGISTSRAFHQAKSRNGEKKTPWEKNNAHAGRKWQRKRKSQTRRLLVNLLLDLLGDLGLLDGDVAAGVGEGLVADLEDGGDGGLALANVALFGLLLGLGVEDVENVVAALETLVDGEEDDGLGVVVELAGGLLDDGEALVDAVQGLVADGVDALDVGRDVLVGLGEVGDDGDGKGLVGRVAELDGLLGVGVGVDGGGDGVDAIADEGVAENVLKKKK